MGEKARLPKEVGIFELFALQSFQRYVDLSDRFLGYVENIKVFRHISCFNSKILI